MASSTRALTCLLLLPICALSGCGSSDVPPTSATASAPGGPPPSAPPPPPPVSAPPPGGIPDWAGQHPDEPFDVKQFLARRAAPPDNAADLYVTAFEQFERTIPGPEPTTLSEKLRKYADLDKLASGAYPADQIRELLNAAQPAIELVDTAQAKPNCVFITGLGPDALMPYAQTGRSLVRLCNLQLHQATRSGDFSLAEAVIKRGLRVSRDLQPRGHEVCQLVSIANDGSLFGAIQRLTLNDPQLSAEQCDRLLTLLIDHQQKMRNRVEEGTCMAYIMLRTAIQDHQAGRLTTDQILDFIGGTSEGDESLDKLRLNYEAEMVACNRIFSLAVSAAKNTATPDFSAATNEFARIKADAKAKIAAKSKAAALQVPYLTMILAGPIGLIDDADRRARTNLAALQMLVALKRYEITHGHLPANLDTAAGETALKTIPTDPYSQSPLKYSVINGKPTIYSVGKDLKDDGGKVDWNLGKQPGDFLFVLSLRTDTKLTPPPVAAATPAKSAPPATRPEPVIREWTSTVGSKIEAEFVGVENGVAKLKKRDGSELRVPLDKLSDADQQWIRSARP